MDTACCSELGHRTLEMLTGQSLCPVASGSGLRLELHMSRSCRGH